MANSEREKTKYLVTGAAGFIGYHTVRFLTERYRDAVVVGLDNINDYYDRGLKYGRLAECGIDDAENMRYEERRISAKCDAYSFVLSDISDADALQTLFSEYKFDYVIHLAAQAGVRYSIENPAAYVKSNLVGFANILECCRRNGVKHLVYASSSSVYGMNNSIPYSEDDNVDYPVSFYAATKKSNEVMAHAYSHLYRLSTTGLRFFTVYGPWGRPDMSPMIFTNAICRGQTLKVFNSGDMLRDFTYIDDIVEGVVRVAHAVPNENCEHPFYRIFNIGNSCGVRLMDFISTIESALGRDAKLEFLPMQAGDVKETFADTSKLHELTGYKPDMPLTKGISKFLKWYKEYYRI